MARPRKNPLPFNLSPQSSPGLVAWAESLGEALGRGVARGINSGLSFSGVGTNTVASSVQGQRRRGRPPKSAQAGAAAGGAVCSVAGCGNPARSKGLCSKHYQAERRKVLAAK